MRVAAIVVAWNAAEDLSACLDALDAQDHDDLEVVVIDNASEDATADVLAGALARPRRHPLRVHTNATNRGFCGGVNDGIALLHPEVAAVLLVNPDARAAPSLVRVAVAALDRDPAIGTVAPRLVRGAPGADGEEQIDTTGHVLTSARLINNRGEGLPAATFHPPAGEIFGASGALVLHRRAMLEDIAWRKGTGREYFTEDLFAYFDDVELDWRARLLGWRAVYEPAACGVHDRRGAAARRSVQVEALNWANRLLLLVTCDDLRAIARYAPSVVATTLLKTAELAITVPRALPRALGRLRLVGSAVRHRRQLRARARVPFHSVPADYVEPFRWQPWIGAWRRRMRTG